MKSATSQEWPPVRPPSQTAGLYQRLNSGRRTLGGDTQERQNRRKAGRHTGERITPIRLLIRLVAHFLLEKRRPIGSAVFLAAHAGLPHCPLFAERRLELANVLLRKARHTGSRGAGKLPGRFGRADGSGGFLKLLACDGAVLLPGGFLGSELLLFGLRTERRTGLHTGLRGRIRRLFERLPRIGDAAHLLLHRLRSRLSGVRRNGRRLAELLGLDAVPVFKLRSVRVFGRNRSGGQPFEESSLASNVRTVSAFGSQLAGRAALIALDCARSRADDAVELRLRVPRVVFLERRAFAGERPEITLKLVAGLRHRLVLLLLLAKLHDRSENVAYAASAAANHRRQARLTRSRAAASGVERVAKSRRET